MIIGNEIKERAAGDSSPLRLATVTSLTGGVCFKLDGNTTAQPKAYRHIGSTPTVGDRILVAAVGGTYVVLGMIV